MSSMFKIINIFVSPYTTLDFVDLFCEAKPTWFIGVINLNENDRIVKLNRKMRHELSIGIYLNGNMFFSTQN